VHNDALALGKGGLPCLYREIRYASRAVGLLLSRNRDFPSLLLELTVSVHFLFAFPVLLARREPEEPKNCFLHSLCDVPVTVLKKIEAMGTVSVEATRSRFG
jgi:hypothetical protein